MWSNFSTSLYFLVAGNILPIFGSTQTVLAENNSNNENGVLEAATARHADTHACCQRLIDAGLANVYLPGADDAATKYDQRVEEYWSLTAQLTPHCFVLPRDTAEVSAAVRALVGSGNGGSDATGAAEAEAEEECRLAVRSGGHSSNAGANNIEQGVTLDLGLLNSTVVYDPSAGIASVGPGSRWLDVYQHLDPHGVSVAGGRLATVGVGGLLGGGGCSLFMFREGFACDNVHAYEVVLANGDVVTASAEQNSDLFAALKGGSNNFGVVTRFNLTAFPMKNGIWSSSRLYPESDTEAHVKAIKEWVDNVEDYQDATAIVFWAFTPATRKIMISAYLMDISGTEAAPIFDSLLAIPGAVESSTSTVNMSTFASATQAEGNIWFTVTLKNDERLLKKAVDLHHALVEEMKAESTDGDFETQCFFNPLPAVVGRHGAEKGGNMMGIADQQDNAVILLGSLAVNGQQNEDIGRAKMMAWKSTMEEYTRSIGMFMPYRYMNYADATQGVVSGYGQESIRVMRAVSDKYDPGHVFQRLVPGGFKIPQEA